MRVLLILFILLSGIVAFGETEKEKRIEELARLIRHHDRLYWQGKTEISDVEYDALVRKLASLAPKHPIVSKVGELDLGEAKKISHSKPMLSLQKVYTEKELFDWIEKGSRSPKERFLIQPKYDGVAADFTKGVLSTRGDGVSGYDISRLLPLIKILKASETGADFRGELIMDQDNFDKVNKKRLKDGESAYKTPRSAVVATLKQADLGDFSAYLTLIDYAYHTHALTSEKFRDKWGEIRSLIGGYPYPMDGVVIKVADKDYAKSIGTTKHHPRSMVAFKFTPNSQKTVIRDVHWSFSSQGLIPVAEFDPVVINAREIRKATLHNADYVRRNDLKIGDVVTVEIAGDTIPKITHIKAGRDKRNAIPKRCPECGTALIFDSVHLICPDSACPGVCYGRLRNVLRKEKVKGLGDKTLLKLVKSCGVRNEKDLVELTEKQIASAPGISEKQARKLHAAIQAWRK